MGLRAEHALCNYVLSFRPEAELYVELSCTCMLHFIFRSPKGAGLDPGVTKYSRGHDEFSAGSEAYGDGFACLLPVASRLVGMLQRWHVQDFRFRLNLFALYLVMGCICFLRKYFNF